jgi:hypothetical protein
MEDVSVAVAEDAVERGCNWIEGMVAEWYVGLLELM